jgi:hypothetical protein
LSLVFGGLLVSLGGSFFVGAAVGLFISRVCFFPKNLNSAFPSFSIPLTQPSIIAGVAAISTANG